MIPAHEERRLRAVATDDEHLRRLIGRRAAGEPLQYLEGTAAFGPIDLVVDERVLIPRPETEGLWELATGLVTAPQVIVDLCTGSGALAIALARSFPEARVVGTDISADALDVARANGRRLAPRVEWRQGDLFDALDPSLEGAVDLLVSNPPYVAEAEWPSLPDDVRREPRSALVAGETGLEVHRRIASELGAWLDGVAVVEIGADQGESAADIYGTGAQIRRDLAGRERYVVVGT